MRITHGALWSSVLSAFLAVPLSLAAQGNLGPNRVQLAWVHGPKYVQLSGLATLDVPQGCAFLGQGDTQILLRALHNPARGDEIGVIAPASPGWLVILRLLNIGHVENPEQNEINSNHLLNSLREQNDRFNLQRQQAGFPIVTIQGWKSPPVVDSSAHKVEWAVDALSNGRQVANRCISVMGRTAVIQLFLINEREDPSALELFRRLGSEVQFVDGQSYQDFQRGDKLARAGLEAVLIGETGTSDQRPVQSNRTGHAKLLLLFRLLLTAVVLISAGFVLAVALGRARPRQIPYPQFKFFGRKTTSNSAHDGSRRVNYDEFYHDLTRDLYHW